MSRWLAIGIKTHENCSFLKVCQVLRSITDVVNSTFTERGMVIVAVESTGAVMSHVYFSKPMFKDFRLNQAMKVGLKLDTLITVLRLSSGPKDTIRM